MKEYDLATGGTEKDFIANLNRIAARGFEVDNGVDVAMSEDGIIFSALMVRDIPDPAKPVTEPQPEPVHPDAPKELWTVKREIETLADMLRSDGYFSTKNGAEILAGDMARRSGDPYECVRVK